MNEQDTQERNRDLAIMHANRPMTLDEVSQQDREWMASMYQEWTAEPTPAASPLPPLCPA